MTLPRFWLCFALAISIALSCVTRARADVVDDGRRWFKEGVAAHKAGRFAEAAELFRKSYEAVRHPLTLRNLADAEIAAGQEVSGARHYRELLHADFDSPLEPELRAAIERALSAVEKDVGRLKITVDIAGANVIVDGEKAGKSPLGYAWHVAPGEHEVLAQLPALEPKRVHATVGAGQIAQVTLTLRKTEPTTAGSGLGDGGGATSSGQNNPERNGHGDSGKAKSLKPIVVIGGAALTVVALGVGVGFGIDRNAANSDADELRDRAVAQVGENGCAAQPQAATCNELRELREREDRSAKIATIGFVAAGAFGVATALTWLLWPGEQPKRTVSTVHVLAGPGRTGLSLSGDF